MSYYLPEALWVEIFHRLPLTSIGSCASVCKAWNSMITSPTFVSTHFQRSLSNPPTPPLPLLLIRHFSPSLLKEQYALCSSSSSHDVVSFRRIAELEYSFSVRSQFLFRFLGSLHGVVCLSDDIVGYTKVIILWNPLIKRHVTLPTPRFTFNTLCGNYMFLLGFGFDSKKNDFKVVRVCYVEGRCREVVPPKAELYSLNDGFWRVIDASYVELRTLEQGFWTQCFLNGNVHWLTYEETESDPFRRNCVMMFNVEEEKFKKMELPEELCTESKSELSVSVIEGCLSVIQVTSTVSYMKNNTCNIWMRREYGVAESWSKTCSIYFEQGIENVLGLRTSGEVLVVPEGEIVSLHSFDTNSQQMKDLGMRGTVAGFCASDFEESLFLLDKESNAVSTVSSPVRKSYAVWVQDDESEGLDPDEIDSKIEKKIEIADHDVERWWI